MGKQPVDEKEQLRQLIRQAHEAAQDARDAKRELESATATIRKELHKAMDAHISEMITPWIETLNTKLRDAEVRISRNCEETVIKARDIVADAAGYKSWDDVRDSIILELIRALAMKTGNDLDEGALAGIQAIRDRKVARRSLRT